MNVTLVIQRRVLMGTQRANPLQAVVLKMKKNCGL